ncbi:MAG TPA: carbohydrate-binding protein [Conexibacter sp.]|nr:carbohydrate-binding protein [Conexibacter sp.]
MTPDPATLPDAPAPQLSPLRVAIALLVVLAAAAGAFFLLRGASASEAAGGGAAAGKGPWFAPYVDATLTPTTPFQDRASNPARDVVLGFVVAGTQPGQSCTPTWGTYETLDGAATTMDLDRRIAQLRGRGGDAVISFGGLANSELAVACDSPTALRRAYRAVISRYAADTVDFDVEGAALTSAAANLRRARAIAAIQADVRAHKRHLAVWLTLPATPQGLDAGALEVVRTTLAAKVDLAGVNVMTMDFGVPSAADDMRGAIESSLNATRRQLAALFGRARVRLNSAHLWRKLGATVMIGQNDTAGEQVTVADARALARWVAGHRLGRASLWSLNRDQQCGVTFAVIGTHSNLCSGVAQKPLQFSKAFAHVLRGTARASASAITTPDLLPEATTETVDDPARSPYPIWQPQESYREGYKVVWHQAVYVAKWYSQGATPDADNVTADNSPWRLVGPVLRTDHAPRIPTLRPGTSPAWAVTKVFRAGDRVLYRGLPYQASWYTQGDVPGAAGDSGAPSPWKPLYRIPGEPVDG